jgi:hypothetical protein
VGVGAGCTTPGQTPWNQVGGWLSRS